MLAGIIRDQDLFRQFVIGRRDEENLSVISQLPDDGVSRSLFDARDAAFGSAAGLVQRDFDFDAVSIHCGSDQSGRYINVALDALNFLLGNDKSISIAMDENRSFDQIADCGLIPAATMLRQLALFNQLVQDLSDLLARRRRDIEILQNVPEICPAIGRLPDISQQILFIEVRSAVSPRATLTSLPPAHMSSLLTSQIEEHRFEIFSRNGGIGRRARFRF